MNRPDAWNPLREFTDARIALGRSGASLPTREVLNFGLAHARARDAIHQPFASQQLVAPLAALGLDALTVHSAAPDRHTYLRRPDLGRQLADESRADLAASGVRPADLLLVIGDGLSSWAVERQAVPLIRALLPYLQTLGIGLAPVVRAHQSRVALGYWRNPESPRGGDPDWRTTGSLLAGQPRRLPHLAAPSSASGV